MKEVVLLSFFFFLLRNIPMPTEIHSRLACGRAGIHGKIPIDPHNLGFDA